MSFLIEKLDVYRLAVDLADALLELSDRLPWRSRALVDQLARAALSIPANIAESNGRHSSRDRQHFLRIARGSLFECIPLLEIARRRNLMTTEEHGELVATAERVSRMLAGLITHHERLP